MKTFAMESSAVISDCGAYRYLLRRRWDVKRPALLFCMLNPSIADAERNDPTIRRCLGFARAWEYGGLEVVNLYAYRATQPAELFRAADPVGPDNDRHIAEAVARAGRVIVGWGNHGRNAERLASVLPLLNEAYCFDITSAGQPRHPLYVRSDAVPVRWRDNGE
jgi:hypothetical protein